MIEAINHWNATPGNTPVTTNVNGDPVVASDGHSLTISGVLEPANHPFFGETPFATQWVGTRSTMQRWFADPVVNVQGVDRGLGIIFTHDHYGPSTHQQVGLYATMLIEPAGSKWVHNETGQGLNLDPDGFPLEAGRVDGGPTSWQAAILTGDDGFGGDYTQNVEAELVENYREFYIEYSDFQHAYQPGVFVGAGPQGFALEDYAGVDANHDGLIDNPWADYVTYVPERLPTAGANIRNSFRDAIQPSFRQQASLKNGFPLDIWEFPSDCPVHPAPGNPGPANAPLRPCPEAISADDPGMYVVNYRNESLAARIFDPDRPGPDAGTNDCSGTDRTGCGMQAEGKAGDLAFAMASNVTRAIPELNDKLGNAPAGYAGGACFGGVFCPPITDLSALVGRDPFTPTMRANDGDRVYIKMQAGGQEEEHTAIVHGLKWLQGGSGFGESKNSGWRNAQAGGISEQFSLRTPIFADFSQRGQEVDYAYSFNASLDGWVTGTWGLLRSGKNSPNLFALPNNDPNQSVNITNRRDFDNVCPKSAPDRDYDITAVTANDVLGAPGGVTIQDLFPGAHVGGSPDGDGGTLVYNSRATTVAATAEARGGAGPLHDPTAMIYFNTDDLVADDAYLDSYKKKGKDVWFWNSANPYCINEVSGVQHQLTGCPVKLRPAEPEYCPDGTQTGDGFCDVAMTKQATDGPNGVYDGAVAMEPLVLRANAGDCMNVTLRNKVLTPATYTDGTGTYRVYRDADLASPAFFDAPGYTYMADLNGDGSLTTGEEVAAADVDWDQTLDLATGNPIIGMVRRDPGAGMEGMTTFQNNLMQPSAHVGLHPQLVEYDVSRSDGTNVGGNPAQQTAAPGTQETYQWYAGHIEQKPDTGPGNKRNIKLVATAIEFGGFNLMPADKIEQGQKALIGAAVIYPQDATWTVDAGTNTVATVWASGIHSDDPSSGINDATVREFRDFTTVGQKGASMLYADSYPVENLLGEGSFGVAEDAQDMGHMAINYGNEALWYRFGINPTDHDGMSTEPNADMAYSNDLNGIGDPETGVLTVTAGTPFRQHVLMPFSPGRGSTYDLHGHVWQRDPYVCAGYGDTGPDAVTLEGKCDMGNGVTGVNGDGQVGSQRLGNNRQGFDLGGIESWFGGQHYDIVIPGAGGPSAVAGDYLYRDHMGLGNAQGLWGIVRVESP
ncbi:MAG: hypothetical protein OEO82_02505 [Gammaproteobacteria bacterium]|nr:hypothetical protein [Gammaproteobacteria bacterium]